MTTVYHADQLPLFPSDTKICKICGIEKPLDQFYQKRGWIEPRCKRCRLDSENDARRTRYAAQHERQRKKFPDAKPGYKYCTTCEQERPLTEFHNHNHGKFGKAATCKDCMSRRTEDKKRQHPPSETARKFSIYHGVIVPMGNYIYPFSKACTKCGEEKPFDQFYIINGWPKAKCKQCKIDESVEWYNGHPEQVKVHLQKRQANPEYIEYHREKEHIRYNTMPEVRQKASKWNKAYKQANPLFKREWDSRRDAQKQATKADPISYKYILERDGMWCYICEKDILPHHELAFDHLIPLRPRKGDPQGTHTSENIHPVHKVCNLRKSNKRFETMLPFDRRGVE